MKKGFVLLCVAASNLFFAANAQTGNSGNYWGQWEGKSAPAKGNVVLQPSSYKIVTLDQIGIQQLLSGIKAGNTATISLPTPEGNMLQFQTSRNTLLPATLRERYPDIMTFTGVATTDKNIVARIDYTTHGFHAMVMEGDNTYFIDPYSNQADGYYTVYYKKDYERNDGAYMVCESGDEEKNLTQGERASLAHRVPSIELKSFGATRKTYRLALSCTGEYAQAVDGPTPTKAGVLSAMTTTMNRVNGIYEKEVAVTMEFIDGMDTLIYLSSSTDPFTANFDGGELLEENQDNTDDVVGTDAYDIGHIFSTGGGGVALLGSVCATWGGKAQGVTGSSSPVGDPYDVDYVAHEMGHQFGAEHTFNRCSGTESETSAYEPGSGSTIMAYAGICGATNNLQGNSNAYFHAHSLDEISGFLASSSPWFGGATCGVESAGASIVSLPSVAATYQIPYNTPFELAAAPATAGAAGTISYVWEQWNLGNFRSDEPGGATFSAGPSFRSFTPGSTTTRIFPRIDSIVRNIAAYRGERLPAVARALRFKLTAREVGADGWGTFHISEDEVLVNVNNTGAPFRVSNPSVAGIRWRRGTTQTVNWDVVGTDASPISASSVDIYLSTDGGYTYPITLATAVPNTGSAGVTVPADITTSTARIKVKGNNNIFFDISNNNFEIGDTTILSIADAELERNIQIYPNPAQDLIQLLATANYRNMQAAMYNSVGQKVWEGKLDGATQIQVGAFARGLYFIHLINTDNGGKVVKRIALQ